MAPSYSTGEAGAFLDLAEMATPANPPVGTRRVYAKATGMVSLDTLGVETPMAGGAAVWGTVSGVLSTQTDLQSALDAKSGTGHNHAGTYEPANANIQTHVAQAHAPSDAQKNSDITKAEIEAKLTGQISSHTHAGGSEAFPIGAVFIAVVSTNPATLLGYGTWAAFAAGRVLVGIDAGQTEFDTARETGGAKTHTLTTAEMPAHTHVETNNSATTGGLAGWAARDTSTNTQVATGYSTESAGGGGAHNNLQPYIVVYMWERTA